MKKIFKSRIFLCILVGISCIGIGVYGANNYTANEISYNPSNGEAINVSEALNELYESNKNTSLSQLAKDANGKNASAHYYGAMIASVKKSFTMNKGKYVLFVFTTYCDLYSSTATGGDTTNKTTISGGNITKINDYCYIVDVPEDNTTISVTIVSSKNNEDRRTIYGIYFYE